MHLHTYLSSLLFAAAALAHPLEHSPLSPSLVKRADGLDAGVTLGENTNFTSVGSLFVMPQLSGDNSGVGFWNEIGASCPRSRIRAGVVCIVYQNRSTVTTCNPASWSSEGAKVFDDFTINPGETIGLAAILTSATAGTVYVTSANGNSFTHQITATQEICQSSARWGLEVIDGYHPADFPKFNSTTFQWALATDANGQSYVPSNNPSISDIVLDGVKMTSTHVEGASVIINHS